MSSLSGLAGLLPERYRGLERLGAGGMATVYRAEDTNLHRPVAIKVLHEHLVYEASFRERFEQEARIVAGFNHPNIIQIYDFAAVEKEGHRVYYMVMPFIPGKTLADILDECRAEDKTLSHDRIRQIMQDITSALGYAHDRGMVHRDVKPGNIIFNENNRAILTDFGIARLAEQSNLTQEGVIVGTPAYMSPEQATAQPIDGRTDIYALGVILYEMLTGRTPFEDDGTLSLLLKHINSPVPGVTEIISFPNPDIDRVILKALAKQPEQRYQTMEAFAADVETIFSGKPLKPLDDLIPPITKEFPRDEPPVFSAPVSRPTPADKIPVPASRLLTTFSTVVIEPARQNPLAFVALAIAVVALVIVARLSQPQPASVPVNLEDSAESMTGDFFFAGTFDADDPVNIYWQQNATGTMTRIIQQGTYILSNSESGRATASLFDPAYTYQNVSIVIEARLTDSSAASSGYGIIFGYHDPQNYYVFAVDGRGRFSLWILENDTWRELRGLDEKWTQNEAVNPLPEKNILKLNIHDNTITGYVNDVEVVRLAESAYSGGGIGIYMATPSRGSASVVVESYETAPGIPATDSMSDDEADSMTDDSKDTMTDDATEVPEGEVAREATEEAAEAAR